jgi:hypothetical protein
MQALVDDVAIAIIHLQALPPPCSSEEFAAPWPLARAASCNDEANELYAEWKSAAELNPSNHMPQHFFAHLYPDAEGVGGSRHSVCSMSHGTDSSVAAASAHLPGSPVAGAPVPPAASHLPLSKSPSAGPALSRVAGSSDSLRGSEAVDGPAAGRAQQAPSSRLRSKSMPVPVRTSALDSLLGRPLRKVRMSSSALNASGGAGLPSSVRSNNSLGSADTGLTSPRSPTVSRGGGDSGHVGVVEFVRARIARYLLACGRGQGQRSAVVSCDVTASPPLLPALKPRLDPV